MTQLINFRSVLAIPAMYKLFQRLVGADAARSTYVKEYVRPKKNNRILDIACGPGDILEYLPSVEYLGFDISQKYIDSAKKRFGNRGAFLCNKVSNKAINEVGSFDIVLAMGILHHLNDDEAVHLFELAHSALKSGGRLVTFDGCYVKGQSPVVRYLISKDRGQYVRTKEGYLNLASEIFANIKVSIRHELLRIPYTFIIMECIP